MFRRTKNHRKLQLEFLESRTLLDGTVLAALDPQSGILRITGDARDNGVLITTALQDDVWSLTVEGTETTGIATRLGRSTTLLPDGKATFPAGAVKGIAIDLKDGRNSLFMAVAAGETGGNFVLAKDFSLKSGKDVDVLRVFGLHVGGNLRVATGGGAEHLELGDADGQLAGIAVNGRATIDAGSGGNYVEIAGAFGNGLSIKTTTGFDNVRLAANVSGDLKINTGSNFDSISVQRVVPGATGPATISGNVTVNTGPGDSSVTFSANVAGNVSLTGGSRADWFLLGSFDAEDPMTLNGRLTINTNAGHDFVELMGNVTGNTDVKTGAGYASVQIGGGTLQGNLSVETGSDRDYVQLDANVNGNVSIKTGAGDDYVAIRAWDPEAPARTIGGNLAVDTGSDNDQVDLAQDVNGNVDVKTGSGDDYVWAGQFQQSPLNFQGNLTVDTGADDDFVNLEGFTVGDPANPQSGNLKIATGDGGELRSTDPSSAVPYIPTELVTAWGVSATKEINIDGGKGDNGVVLLLCNAANVNLTTAAGNSLIAIGQLGMNGTGTLAVRNGPGDNTVFIGTAFPWDQFIFNLPEEGIALEFGVAAAAVTINTASVYTGEVIVESSAIDKSLTVNVAGGDARIDIRNIHGLPIPGGFAPVGRVSLRTGGGNDTIVIPEVQGIGLKATDVSIATGAGNDWVGLVAVAADRALLDLGAGDDFLACAEHNAVASFLANGGAGRDSYEGPFPLPNGWTANNFEQWPTP